MAKIDIIFINRGITRYPFDMKRLSVRRKEKIRVAPIALRNARRFSLQTIWLKKKSA